MDKKEEENKEEEGEKKFNPKEFLWTNTNGIAKTLSQIYNKLKPVVWVFINSFFIKIILKLLNFP